MPSLLDWAAKIGMAGAAWLFTNPEKAALITIGFIYERKLTIDILKGAGGVLSRSIVGGTGPGIIQTTGQALATRFPSVVRAGSAIIRIPYITPISIALAGRAVLETSGFYDDPRHSPQTTIENVSHDINFLQRMIGIATMPFRD